MDGKDILIYFAFKYKGDWERIFQAITNKEEYDEEEYRNSIAGKINSKVITILDDEYPEYLKNIFRPPFVLFYHGDISLIADRLRTLAVVGARECSEYGVECTKTLVKDLCKKLIIVSGMAKGIDAIAHNTAIENGGKTIAVLGSGINKIYPAENKDLYNKLIKNHLVVSEYPDKTEPNAKYFPIRNRLVAAFTTCCLVTDAKIKSGSSITASLVLNDGGYVCCVPHQFGEESLCNKLIHQGACLVETYEDILEEMSYYQHV